MTKFVVDCQWSDWQIGECSVPCGGGTRTNNRSKIVEEKNEGSACTGEPTEREDCNYQNCPGKLVLYFVF